MAPTMLRMIASGALVHKNQGVYIAQLMNFVWCVTKKFALVHKKRVVFAFKVYWRMRTRFRTFHGYYRTLGWKYSSKNVLCMVCHQKVCSSAQKLGCFAIKVYQSIQEQAHEILNISWLL